MTQTHVIVGDVIHKHDVPGSAKLTSYLIRIGDDILSPHSALEVVGNNENTYEVGERVRIVQGPCIFEGQVIQHTMLRNQPSNGMILGIAKPEEKLGDDVSSEYDTHPLPMAFLKWPSIGGFASVRKQVSKRHFNEPIHAAHAITWKSKVKLDGTNAAVVIYQDVEQNICVQYQSRKRVLGTGKDEDNAGFCVWAKAHEEFFKGVYKSWYGMRGPVVGVHCGYECPPINRCLAIYGEWAGPGVIGKDLALNKLSHRVFAIFACVEGNPQAVRADVHYEPEWLDCLLRNQPEQLRPRDLHILPWTEEMLALNIKNKSSETETYEDLNTCVEGIGKLCPWVKDTFGVEGPGEGLVFYPHSYSWSQNNNTFYDTIYLDEAPHLLWKAKSEAHRVKKSSKAVKSKVGTSKDVLDFVETFATEQRMAQMLQELYPEGEFTRKNTRDFISACVADIHKESVDEREASPDLNWEQCAHGIVRVTRAWFLNRT